MTMIPIGQKKPRKIKYEKKKHYWFKVSFGRWIGEDFNPKTSHAYVEAVDGLVAAKLAIKRLVSDKTEIITSVEFLGFPQVK